MRNTDHIIAGLRLLEAHASDGHSEAHNFEGLKIDMSPDEVRGLIKHFENLQELVELGYRSRADFQGYKGAKRKDAQADFLAGAGYVINEVPPRWYFACMKGELL